MSVYPQNIESKHIKFGKEKSLILDCGKTLESFNLSYMTYGKLNENKSNAILLFHPLTGDQFVCGKNPVTGKDGWWDNYVGSNKPIDTDKYFIVCINILGGCMGSEGPKSINPKTNKHYGLDFPCITLDDVARSQKLLIEHFGIKKLYGVAGGSMGGMLALKYCELYPDEIENAFIVAAGPNMSARNIGINEVSRQSIMRDVNWNGGDYYENNEKPNNGLNVARMFAHITYLSEQSMDKKFGRNLQDKKNFSYDVKKYDFQVESYLNYQGKNFVDRFDANSYLYITKALDYFDITNGSKSGISSSFNNCKIKFLIASIDSDWLFSTKENYTLVHKLTALGLEVSFFEIESDFGHDGFLVENVELSKIIEKFFKEKK